jgi:mRNA-degrading endonuclease RelE of RelBE toxin-antitoxin system
VSYRVIPSERFKREARRLSKKYPSLTVELAELDDILTNDPRHGTSLGFGLYKIRLAIRSKHKGKRGGGRVITYFVDGDDSVYLVTIYDKSDIETISSSRLREFVSEIFRK